MSDAVQPQEAREIWLKKVTPKVLQDNIEFLQRSVVRGLGLEQVDYAIMNRAIAAIQSGAMKILVFMADDNEVVGSLTYYVGRDFLRDQNTLWICSLHCSDKMSIAAWRRAMAELVCVAAEEKADLIAARTKFEHVRDIAQDSNFDVEFYIERKV